METQTDRAIAPVTHYGAEWMSLCGMLEMSHDPGAPALHRIIDRALSAKNHTLVEHAVRSTVAEQRITIDLDADELALHDWACDKTRLTAGRLTVRKETAR